MLVVAEEISASEVAERWERGDFEVLRVADIEFSVTELAEITEGVCRDFKLAEKDGTNDYRAICLQYRITNDDPLYGDVNRLPDKTDWPIGPCTLPTVVGLRYRGVFNELSRYFQVERGRLLAGAPAWATRFHVDGIDERRLHIPVLTDSAALLEYAESGNAYHLRAGKLYLMNAAIQHRAVNHSFDERLHLVFVLRRPEQSNIRY